jgi:diamine N-acetyltransferase
LGTRTFRDTSAADSTPSDMAAYLAAAFSEDIQRREIGHDSSEFLIAHVDSAAVGYARIRFGSIPSCVSATRPCEIVRFYVDAPAIGAGIGSALMAECLARAAAHGSDVVWLAVWERNSRAIAFYTRWRFEVVGEGEFVLGDGVQHDLLMARPARDTARDDAPADGGPTR